MVETKEQVINVFDEIASSRAWESLYAQELDPKVIDRTSYNFLSRRRAVGELLTPYLRGRVIDIGCGSGDFVPIFAGKVDSYVGVDLSAKMIERGTANYHDESGTTVSFEVGDSEAVPHEDASFDITVAVGLIEYFPNPTKCLHEIYRLTRPGGYALVTVPYNRGINTYSRGIFKPLVFMVYSLYAMVRRRPLQAMRNVKHYAYSGRQLDDLMVKNRFDKVDHRYTNFHCLPFPLENVFPRTYVRLSERIDRGGSGERSRWLASNYIGLYRKQPIT